MVTNGNALAKKRMRRLSETAVPGTGTAVGIRHSEILNGVRFIGVMPVL